MSRIQRANDNDNKQRRNNPLRAQRRPPIVESPEFEPSGCHCRIGHKDFGACSADPKSPYYSPGGPGPKSLAAMAKTKQNGKKPVAEDRGNKKRKADTPLPGEIRYTCECGGGHDNELECEYASVLKKHVEITTSIIIGSQEVVTINVGTEVKQSFHVHKELLILYSTYFQDLFAGRINEQAQAVPNQDVKEESESDIKQEEMSAGNLPVGSRDGYARHNRPAPDVQEGTMSDTKQEEMPADNLPPRSRNGFARRNHPNQAPTHRPLESPSPDPINLIQPSRDHFAPSPQDNNPHNYPHHNYLHPLISPSPTNSQRTYSLPTINPSQFAQFISFIYAGRIVDAFEPLIMTIEHNSVEALWYVGQILRSPSFQNNILEGLRTSESVKSGAWPSVEDVEIVYNLDHQGEEGVDGEGENKLKKFGAHCLGANNPLVRYESGSLEGQACSDLFFKKRPEIAKDVLMVAGSQWALNHPWDDSLRGDYVVEEEGVEERWERMILARRGRVGVKEAAKRGDVGAKLEEGHLEAEKKKLRYERWGYDSDDEDD